MPRIRFVQQPQVNDIVLGGVIPHFLFIALHIDVVGLLVASLVPKRPILNYFMHFALGIKHILNQLVLLHPANTPSHVGLRNGHVWALFFLENLMLLKGCRDLGMVEVLEVELRPRQPILLVEMEVGLVLRLPGFLYKLILHFSNRHQLGV